MFLGRLACKRGRRRPHRGEVEPMQLLVELVLLVRSLVDLARSVVEAHGARGARGRHFAPKAEGRRRGGLARNKRGR